MTEGVVTYEEKPREQWIFDYPAQVHFLIKLDYLNLTLMYSYQVALTGTQIWWTVEVNISFARLEEGYENALKDYFKKEVNQLNSLIAMLIGKLTSGERQKIMTICTIDVHARDVIGKLIAQKV